MPTITTNFSAGDAPATRCLMLTAAARTLQQLGGPAYWASCDLLARGQGPSVGICRARDFRASPIAPCVAIVPPLHDVGETGADASLDAVLRFHDDRTDSYVELAARPSIPLRMCVQGSSVGATYDLANVRVLLVSDVLTRIAELRGLQVIAVLVTASLPPGTLEQNASALGIHPPAVCANSGEAEALLGGPADVRVAGTTAELGDHGDAVLICIGPVEDLAYQGESRPWADPGASGGGGGDLLALRLALLYHSHRQAVELTLAALADAGEALSRWRRKVAEWAREPSKPIPAETARMIAAAFDDDLNTAAVLAFLRSVESDDNVPAGAKFETFAYADRVLGLELVRDIGH
jgi:hypothetical protein